MSCLLTDYLYNCLGARPTSAQHKPSREEQKMKELDGALKQAKEDYMQLLKGTPLARFHNSLRVLPMETKYPAITRAHGATFVIPCELRVCANSSGEWYGYTLSSR